MSERKRYSSQDKVNILREHFEQNATVATLCEKHRVHLTFEITGGAATRRRPSALSC